MPVVFVAVGEVSVCDVQKDRSTRWPSLEDTATVEYHRMLSFYDNGQASTSQCEGWKNGMQRLPGMQPESQAGESHHKKPKLK